VSELQDLGLWVETDCEGKSIKSQLRRADKLHARYSMVLGENELANNRIALKRMDDGNSQDVELDAQALAAYCV
jgi:histidyl-tRNA synthetase